MALTLKEVTGKKKSQEHAIKAALGTAWVEEAETVSSGKKLAPKPQRPWERAEQAGPVTRTLRAQEAVKRAREIVRRNDELVQGLKRSNLEALGLDLEPELELLDQVEQPLPSASFSDFRIKTRRSNVLELLRKIIRRSH